MRRRPTPGVTLTIDHAPALVAIARQVSACRDATRQRVPAMSSLVDASPNAGASVLVRKLRRFNQNVVQRHVVTSPFAGDSSTVVIVGIRDWRAQRAQSPQRRKGWRRLPIAAWPDRASRGEGHAPQACSALTVPSSLRFSALSARERFETASRHYRSACPVRAAVIAPNARRRSVDRPRTPGVKTRAASLETHR